MKSLRFLSNRTGNSASVSVAGFSPLRYAAGALFIVAATFCPDIILAQQENVGIGTRNPDNSAVLDVSKELLTSPKGLLIPRMTHTERNSIANPAIGLLIFQTDMTSGFYYYNGIAWVPFLTLDINFSKTLDTLAWSLHGNAGTNPASNFLGTRDASDLILRTNNVERLRLPGSGGVNVASLTSGGLVKAAVGTGALTLASNGPGGDYEIPLIFENGLTRGANTVRLGGALTSSTGIALGNNNLTFEGQGKIGIGTANPAQTLEVRGNVLVSGLAGNAAQIQYQSSSGTAVTTFQAGTQNTNIAYTWPTTAPGTNQVLVASGGSNSTLSWVDPTSFSNNYLNGLTKTGNDIRLGGTLTGATVIGLGANDLRLSQAGDAGNVVIGKFTAAGIVKNTATGVLTSGSLNLASNEVSGILPPVSGGTGSGVAPTAGQVLVGTNTGIYSPGAIVGSGNVTVSNSGGNIVIGMNSNIGTGTTDNSTLRWDAATNHWVENTNVLSTPAGNLTAMTGLTLGSASTVNSPITTRGSAGANNAVMISRGAGASPEWTSNLTNLTIDNSTLNNAALSGTSTTINSTTLNVSSGTTTNFGGPVNFNGTVKFNTLPDIPLPQNNFFIGNGAGVAVPFAPGANGTILTINNGAPVWSNTLSGVTFNDVNLGGSSTTINSSTFNVSNGTTTNFGGPVN
ncbi:MAG: hypothetical protein LC116_06070, partial [Bacteroidetes bacterium]|nr:hypothetical protein [Bacteroidota bacterium]